jgi:hypothetical protein
MEIPQNFACLLITYHMENRLWLKGSLINQFLEELLPFSTEYFIKMDMCYIFLIGIP